MQAGDRTHRLLLINRSETPLCCCLSFCRSKIAIVFLVSVLHDVTTSHSPRVTGLAYHYLQWDSSDSAPIEAEEEDGEEGKRKCGFVDRCR